MSEEAPAYTMSAKGGDEQRAGLLRQRAELLAQQQNAIGLLLKATEHLAHAVALCTVVARELDENARRMGEEATSEQAMRVQIQAYSASIVLAALQAQAAQNEPPTTEAS